MTHPPLPPLALAAALGLLAARTAWALWVEYQITPKSLATENRTFAVKTEPIEGKITFTVRMSAKKRTLSPYTTGYLTIPEVAHVPIEGKRSGETLTYWFTLAPGALPGARFEIHESNWTRGMRASPEILMGGQIFTLLPAGFTGEAK